MNQIPVDFPLDRKKRAVIVGASSGIGEALAYKLADEGYVLALLSPEFDRLKGVADKINEKAGVTVALAYDHDATKFDKVPQTFQKVLADLGQMDAMFYIAGVMPTVAIDEYDFAKDLAMVNVNMLGGMAWMGQAAVLFERMGAGHIVGIASVAADRGRVKNPGYNASKAGLDTYMEALRNRLTRKGVHVMSVKPGFVDTEMLKDAGKTFGVISPKRAAELIYGGMQRRTQIMYAPWWWRYMMLVIIHMPSFIFRRMSF